MDEVVLHQGAWSDEQAMRLAIEEANKGWGFVSPNPAVGCVILDNKNHFLSKGFHEKFGGPHAEVNALRGLTEEQLRGARLFVTLEPCAHHGKTPPCAEVLAKLPLSEVVYGLLDPNPLVAGKGLDIIRKAGIKVSPFLSFQDDLEKVCEHFLLNMKQNKPFVSLKVATSLDGKLALKSGQSQWITGEEARLEAHYLRAQHDAILVGVNTFLLDNPSLTLRHPQFPEKSLKVVVLDPMGRGVDGLAKSKLYQNNNPNSIFWVIQLKNKNTISISSNKTDQEPADNIEKLKKLQSLGVNVIQLPIIEKEIPEMNLSHLLSDLWKYKICSILVEGGGGTLSSFINQGVAHRLNLFLAPIIIGDKNGIGWASQLNEISKLEQSYKLNGLEISTKGKDLLLSARFL